MKKPKDYPEYVWLGEVYRSKSKEHRRDIIIHSTRGGIEDELDGLEELGYYTEIHKKKLYTGTEFTGGV